MGQGIILSIDETCKDDYTTVKASSLFWVCIQSTLPKRVGLRTKSSSCKIAYIDIEMYMWRNVIYFTLFVLMKKVIPLYRALLSLLIKLYNYWRASKILPVADLKSTFIFSYKHNQNKLFPYESAKISWTNYSSLLRLNHQSKQRRSTDICL